jgi:hypothetical protein
LNKLFPGIAKLEFTHSMTDYKMMKETGGMVKSDSLPIIAQPGQHKGTLNLPNMSELVPTSQTLESKESEKLTGLGSSRHDLDSDSGTGIPA